MKETIEYNTMKKFSFLFLSVFLLAFTGCNQEEPPVPDPTPTLEVSASPEVVEYMGSSVVSWSSKNADYVLMNSQKLESEGSLLLKDLKSSTTYRFIAVAPNNSKSAIKEITITVTKVDAPTIDLTAPDSIPYGTSTSFSWNTGGLVDYVLLDGLATDSSSFTTPILYESKEYTVTVDGPGGKIIKKVMIYVRPQNRYTIFTTCGPNGSVLPEGNEIVKEGKDITFTFQPEECFEMNTLKVDGAEVPLTSSLTLTNVTSDKNIEVTFKKDSILWYLQKIVWRLEFMHICNEKGEILFSYDRYDDNLTRSYSSDGIYSETVDGRTIYPLYSIDKSTSPATLIDDDTANLYYYKIETLDDEKMVLFYKIGEVYWKAVFVNERYK